MDVLNARTPQSTSSGYAAYMSNAQVAEDQQEFHKALEQRDVCCIMSGLGPGHYCKASHIISYTHENAVRWHPLLVTQHKLIPFSGSRSSL